MHWGKLHLRETSWRFLVRTSILIGVHLAPERVLHLQAAREVVG